MTFRDWLTERDGRWMCVWTIDAAQDRDGVVLSIVGRLKTYDGFIEMMMVEGTRHAVPFSSIASINERSDADELTMKLIATELKHATP